MSSEERKEYIANVIDNLNSIEDKVFTAILYLTGARPQEVKLMTKKDITEVGDDVVFYIRTVKRGFDRSITLSKNTPFIGMILKYIETLKYDDELIYKKTLRAYRHNIDKASHGKLCPYSFRHFRTDYIVRMTSNLDVARYWRGTKTLDAIVSYLHLAGVMTKKLKDKIE